MGITNKKIIVVLGMHRSGTSVITRGLQVLGVELGDRMMQPVEDNNPKGFWEDIDINALNIDLLKEINSDWCHLTPISPDDVDILRKKGFILRAIELLRQKTEYSAAFGFKDPRVAKLLPFWKEVFGHCQFDVKYVLTLRHPMSVAKSLAKRDGVDMEQSYLLWLNYVITSLSGSAKDTRILVDYDRFMESPVRELERIAQTAGLVLDQEELETYIAEYLDQNLRHTLYGINDLLLDEGCPIIVRDAYSALLEVASDHAELGNEALKNKTEHWVAEFERNRPAMMLVDKLLRKNDTANQLAAERDLLLNQQIKENEERVALINQNTRELNEKDMLLHKRNIEVQEKDALVHQRNLELINKDTLLDQRNLVLEEKDELLRHRNLALQEKDELLRHRNLALQEKDEQLNQINMALKEKDEKLNQRNIVLKEKDEKLNQRNIALKEKDEKLNQRNMALKEKDKQLNQINMALKEKDEKLNQRNMALKEKDEQLNQRNMTLKEKGEQLNRQNQALEESHAHIAELESRLIILVEEKNVLERKLENVYASFIWKISYPLRRLAGNRKQLNEEEPEQLRLLDESQHRNTSL